MPCLESFDSEQGFFLFFTQAKLNLSRFVERKTTPFTVVNRAVSWNVKPLAITVDGTLLIPYRRKKHGSETESERANNRSNP